MSDRTCSVEGCSSGHKARGWCDKHYYQLWIVPNAPRCSVVECNNPATRVGLCSTHALRVKNGQPLEPPVRSARKRGAGALRNSQGQKHCPECDRWRDVSCFYNNPTHLDGLFGKCNECCEDRRLEQRYGLQPGEYHELVERQGGLCAVCGGPETISRFKKLSVDHDHSCCPGEKSCGRCVRGLICGRCNRTLGLVDDNPELLSKMAEYINAHAGHKKAGRV